ncbi:MAG: hypothetical protein N2484_05025 [Clostridia bacterium]|nr:hypothetical protein [Clostridia bacterium]
MQTNFANSLKKIMMEFGKVGSFSRAILKYGTQAFLALLALGTFLIVFNMTALGFDVYLQFVAISVIKNSFIILAEVIIGGLLIDYILKK